MPGFAAWVLTLKLQYTYCMAKKTGKKVVNRSGKKPASSTVSKSIDTATIKPKQANRTLPMRAKEANKLPSVWQLTKTSTNVIRNNKKLLFGITLVYGFLSLILVQGLASGTNVNSLESQFSKVFSGSLGSLASGASIFVLLLGNFGHSTSATAGPYELFLGLITSLAVIWALRRLSAGQQLRIRDAFYKGMFPIIPFVLVLLVIGIQLLPLLFGASIYSLVISNGIAVHLIEKFLWAVLFAALATTTFYMLTSSLFALYIVTLPDMTPVKALRSARDLVRGRRWPVFRKVVCLPFILIIGAAVIMVPIIVILTPLAQWVFFLLTMFALVAVHTYMYTLYAELLDE